MIFQNRAEAGRLLAQELIKYKNQNPVVLALPRGGVTVGFEAAKVLGAFLDTVVARKLGVPFNEEFGFGAIAPGRVLVLNEETISSLDLAKDQIDQVVKKETVELERREGCYKSGSYLKGKVGTAIIVDDGLATGVTAQAAIRSVKKIYNPEILVFAVPVASRDVVEKIKQEVDGFVCLSMPYDFFAIGQWYKDFEQVTDQEVIDCLEKSQKINS